MISNRITRSGNRAMKLVINTISLFILLVWIRKSREKPYFYLSAEEFRPYIVLKHGESTGEFRIVSIDNNTIIELGVDFQQPLFRLQSNIEQILAVTEFKERFKYFTYSHNDIIDVENNNVFLRELENPSWISALVYLLEKNLIHDKIVVFVHTGPETFSYLNQVLETNRFEQIRLTGGRMAKMFSISMRSVLLNNEDIVFLIMYYAFVSIFVKLILSVCSAFPAIKRRICRLANCRRTATLHRVANENSNPQLYVIKDFWEIDL
ncbi:hypothetical protein ACOME3_008477 [Neoechinorhynchus agilis]